MKTRKGGILWAIEHWDEIPKARISKRKRQALMRAIETMLRYLRRMKH